MAAVAAMSSKSQTAHDDTQEFIRGLEMTARRILTKANKRRTEELRHQQSMARKIGPVDTTEPPKKFVVEVPPRVDERGNQLASMTMEVASTGMTAAVKALGERVLHRSLDDIDETRSHHKGATDSTLPPLGGNGSPNDISVGDSVRDSSAGRKLPKITRGIGSLTMFRVPSRTTPSGVGRRQRAGEGGGSISGESASAKMFRATAPPAKIDDRLTASPLFSASMVELTKPPKCAIADAGGPKYGAGQDEEAPGGISNMRVLTASKVLDGKGAGAAAVLRPTARNPKPKGVQFEGQGVTSWSSDDLRVKYRAEREREEAYQAFRLQKQVAETLEQDYGQVIAVTEIDRHLLCALFFAQLERENTQCLLRVSARNKMKRFVTDVHMVWLTNLAHHPEFRRMVTDPAAVVPGVEPTGVIGAGADGNTLANNNNKSDLIFTRRGLDGGRDTAAIAASRSQIQSVRPELAFRQSVYYSSESKPFHRAEDGRGVELELEPRAPHAAPSARLYDDDVNADVQGGEPLKLLPLPPKAPTLTVFVSERRRLAACPKGGDRKRSRDGGRRGASGVGESGIRQRSARGSGTIGASALLSETRTRMIRVRRFQPEAAATQDMILRSPIEGEGGRAQSSNDRCSSTVARDVTRDPETSGATWIVSSYLPYDGSEAHVFVRDNAVKDTVGEALSAPCYPFSFAAGPLDVETGVRGRATGLDGAIGGDARLLVLRRGLRIPVLDIDGCVGGTMLAVLEVFVFSCRAFNNNMVPSTTRSAEDKGSDRRSAADDTLLEITAYPVFPCSPPHGRRRGRQRAILTAESLWQRRKRMHPDVTLGDSPPQDFVDWLRDASGDYQPDSWINSAGEKRHTGVRVDGARERSDREVRDPSDGHGGEVGGSDWTKRVAETSSKDALEDIVRMVAFGPQDGLDCDDRQHGCRAMPLLLRPPQSFGLEVPAGQRVVERSSEPNAGIIPGGTAALVNESIAEVLLSLVRLEVFGSRGPEISLDGIPSSALDEGCQERVRSWEDDADSVESLSMRVCGRHFHTRDVPGTTAVGKMGVTFTYPQAKERTQPVGFFFRDASISSSDSVMVVISLALDTPNLTPMVTAWERRQVQPEEAPDEDVLGIVPRAMIAPRTVQTETVISELDTRKAPGAVILTSAGRGADFYSEAAMTNGVIGDKLGNAAIVATTRDAETGRLLRRRRDWTQVDEKGFRRFIVYQLLEPDGHLETLAFGITKRATLPNAPAVCGRSTFHSDQRFVGQLCRKRTAKDYAYVSASPSHRGPSDPGTYSVSCKHERMKTLMRTGLERYNAEMARIAVERERQAKTAALQAKVEAGKAQLAKRRAKEDAMARSLVRKADAKKLKFSAGASRSRRKWELRLQDSHVLETRGKWEKRQDGGGSMFYHCVSEEARPEPFSWDPPEIWEAVASVGAETVTSGEENASTSVVAEEANDELLSLRAVGAAQEPGTGISTETSLALVARTYTDDEKVSLAVTRLAENEKLLGALAWRLGIPLVDVRRDGREPRLARGCTRNGVLAKKAGGEEEDGNNDDDVEEEAFDEEELDENREKKELADLDEMSDSDGEHGDAREPPGPMPQDHSDLRRIRIAKRRIRSEEFEGFGYKQPRQPSVPLLPLGEVSQRARGSAIALPPQGLPAAESLETQLVGMGWRRLAKATLGKTFLEKIVKSRTQGPRPVDGNTLPKPQQTGTTDPTMASRRSEDFSVPVDTMFVADVVAEHSRLLHESKRRMELEELVGEESSGSFHVDKLAAIGPQEFTTVEKRLMALTERDGRSKEEMEAGEANAKAIVAAKTGNLEELEGLLYDESLPIDSRDSNGNTLLILAAQQGNKRLVKFLLRKGANINHQNMDGNTVLHFCYSTGGQDLANYLESKGADDLLLNSEGLTCYEGLQAQQLEAI